MLSVLPGSDEDEGDDDVVTEGARVDCGVDRGLVELVDVEDRTVDDARGAVLLDAGGGGVVVVVVRPTVAGGVPVGAVPTAGGVGGRTTT